MSVCMPSKLLQKLSLLFVIAISCIYSLTQCSRYWTPLWQKNVGKIHRCKLTNVTNLCLSAVLRICREHLRAGALTIEDRKMWDLDPISLLEVIIIIVLNIADSKGTKLNMCNNSQLLSHAHMWALLKGNKESWSIVSIALHRKLQN